MTKTTSPPEVRAALDTAINADWFAYLYGRWQDEKEYEDFEDYKKAVAKNMPGFTVVRATKRPFSFFLTHPKMPGVTYELQSTARSARWRRV